MKNSQIIIGTSSWGSKINFKKSLDLGNKLISMGLNRFDTAPTYGGGNAHYILNYLGRNNKIFVDTKYGQIISPTPKEILKRFYRFINIKSFKQSFEFIEFNKERRNQEKFWSIANIEKYIYRFKGDLSNCELKTFYLHSPPHKILSKDYLRDYINLMESKKISPGVSWPDDRDLDLFVNYFSKITLQLTIKTFEDSKEKILGNIQSLNLNSIFRKKKNYSKEYKNKFDENVLQFLDKKDNYKIIIGLNSNESIEKLKELLING